MSFKFFKPVKPANSLMLSKESQALLESQMESFNATLNQLESFIDNLSPKTNNTSLPSSRPSF